MCSGLSLGVACVFHSSVMADHSVGLGGGGLPSLWAGLFSWRKKERTLFPCGGCCVGCKSIRRPACSKGQLPHAVGASTIEGC